MSYCSIIFNKLDFPNHSKVMMHSNVDDILTSWHSVFYFPIQALTCVQVWACCLKQLCHKSTYLIKSCQWSKLKYLFLIKFDIFIPLYLFFTIKLRDTVIILIVYIYEIISWKWSQNVHYCTISHVYFWWSWLSKSF